MGEGDGRELTEAERRVLARAGLDDAAPAPGVRDVVAAAFVRALLDGRHGRPAGALVVTGADIADGLDLSDWSGERPLRFEDCRFAAPLAMARAAVPELALVDCQLPAIALAGARLGSLLMERCTLRGAADRPPLLAADALTADRVVLGALSTVRLGGAVELSRAQLGELRLTGWTAGATGETLALIPHEARIGRLVVSDCALTRLSARGLSAASVAIDRAGVTGHVQLDGLDAQDVAIDRSHVGGSVRLDRARVAGDVSLRGGAIGSGKLALAAEHAAIGGTLRLGAAEGEALVASGAVRLVAASMERLEVAARIEQLGGIDAARARIEALVLEDGASVAGLTLDRAELGTLTLADGAELTGPLRARRLTLAGPLLIDGTIAVAEGPAVAIASSRFEDTFHLGRGLHATGPVQLDYCEIAGDTVLRGRIAAPDANAIDIAGLRCERLVLNLAACEGGISVRRSEASAVTLHGEYRCPPDLPLHLGVSCRGRITVGEAEATTRISGTLSLIDATCRELLVRHLAIDAPTSGRWAGMAFAARHLSVATLARIGHPDEPDGVTATSALAFDYASFGDDVRLSGVHAAQGDDGRVGGAAVQFRSANVRGDLVLGEAGAPLVAAGPVDLSALKVGGDLRLAALSLAGDGEEARALLMAGTQVSGTLAVSPVAAAGPWWADLEDASTEVLDDGHGTEWAHPDAPAPLLRLASFRYRRLGDLGAASSIGHEEAINARLAWIERHGTAAGGRLFRAAPFHTLASVLEEVGDLSGVKQVEVATRRAKRRSGGQPWWVRGGDWLFDAVSGYGYAPGRALTALLAFFLIGWAGTAAADRAGAFEPSPELESVTLARAIEEDPHGCIWLVRPLYALDSMLPVIELGQQDLCDIRAEARGWVWARATFRMIGYVLVSMALLTFSGLLKRESE